MRVCVRVCMRTRTFTCVCVHNCVLCPYDPLCAGARYNGMLTCVCTGACLLHAYISGGVSVSYSLCGKNASGVLISHAKMMRSLSVIWPHVKSRLYTRKHGRGVLIELIIFR